MDTVFSGVQPKERLLTTIITLHHLFFDHCVNPSVIVFGPRYFSSGATLPLKIPRSKTTTSDPISHNDLKTDGARLVLSKY